MTTRILTGDCRTVLPTLPESHYQMVVTSPPYWRLRDYKVEGQLGLEDDPKDYLEKLVGIFRQVARVLRPDGTLWLNMGDCYTDGGRGTDVGSTLQGSRHNQGESRANNIRVRQHKPFGLGRKQLIGMPWRVAFALQEDGWVLRSDIVWRKRNPMPESCTDRPTKAHEYLFLFSRQRFYYYDRHAIAELATGNSHHRGNGVGPKARVPSGWDDRESSSHHENLGRYSEHRKGRAQSRLRGRQNESFSAAVTGLVATRNARSVWEMSTAPFRGAHFATFPPELAERCIQAGTSRDACPACGAAFKRLTRARTEHLSNAAIAGTIIAGKGHPSRQVRASHDIRNGPTTFYETIGWAQRCRCAIAPDASAPQRILDPFGGAGTVGLVAERLGRDSDLIELSPSYSQMARERIDADAPLFTKVLPGA